MTRVEQTPHSSTIVETFLDTYFPRKNNGIHFRVLLEYLSCCRRKRFLLYSSDKSRKWKTKLSITIIKASQRQGLYLENLLYLGFDFIHIPFVTPWWNSRCHELLMHMHCAHVTTINIWTNIDSPSTKSLSSSTLTWRARERWHIKIHAMNVT